VNIIIQFKLKKFKKFNLPRIRMLGIQVKRVRLTGTPVPMSNLYVCMINRMYVCICMYVCVCVCVCTVVHVL
jgi:hypothetical protein